jgi:hypothetical protein
LAGQRGAELIMRRRAWSMLSRRFLAVRLASSLIVNDNARRDVFT